jgi:hypothetical protein
MEEGLFQLLFILFFIVAAIFDAVARSRGKRRQMEEMETEEGAQDAEATAQADRADPEAAKRRRAERAQARWERMEQQRRDRRKAPDGRGRETDARAETRESRDRPHMGEAVGQGRGEGAAEPERQTADSMVPDDFWAILTGQTPSSRSEPEAEPQLEPEDVAFSEAEPPREPGIPAPVASDRWTAGSRSGARTPRAPEPPLETRRSSRWMEGVGGREDSSRWTKGMDEEEKRVYTLPPEPWEALEDITAGEISDGRGRVQGSVEGGAAAGGAGRRRRGSGRGAYTRLLETGEIEDMRKAIVLREVLGTPVGFRKQDRDWDLG